MPRWKRTMDVAASLVALPMLVFCMLLMMVVQRFCSPGPVFFKQERVGLHGRRFRIYKFRTMTDGADFNAHEAYYNMLMSSGRPMAKLDSKGDQRLMPGGWLLRASGMDELPQLLNILKGDMTIVGPRPCIPYEYEKYTAWQKQRFESTPGLTGLWQVSGKNRTTFDEMIQFDHEYTETASLWLDTKIILMTPTALLMQVLETRSARIAKTEVLIKRDAPNPDASKRIHAID